MKRKTLLKSFKTETKIRACPTLVLRPFERPEAAGVGLHSDAITRRLKSCVNKFYGFVNLRVVFRTLAELSLSFFQQRYHLRSASGLILKYPSLKLKKTLGDSAFSSAFPNLWNSLPLHIRLVDNFERFESLLKTHLFKLAFEM